ncbi:hypothetical protein AAC387_Pa12g0638 [Persea americana]
MPSSFELNSPLPLPHLPSLDYFLPIPFSSASPPSSGARHESMASVPSATATTTPAMPLLRLPSPCALRMTEIVKKSLKVEIGFSANPFHSNESLFLGTLYNDLMPNGEGSG